MDIIALSSETISRLNKALKECDFCSFGFESLKRLESGVLLGSLELTTLKDPGQRNFNFLLDIL